MPIHANFATFVLDAYTVPLIPKEGSFYGIYFLGIFWSKSVEVLKVNQSEYHSFVQVSNGWVLNKWVWINARKVIKSFTKSTSSTLEWNDEITR